MAKRQARLWLSAALIGLLAACGGGGGGDRAEGVDPGPTAPGGSVPPPTPIVPGPVGYADAEEIFAFINSASIGSDGRAVVDFQLTDGNNTAIIDLELSNVRFVLAKLQGSPLGNNTGSWQSYVNRIESAGSVGTGTEDKLQATYERDGELSNSLDGFYQYTYATDVNNPPADELAQAKAEGLNLDYDPSLTHRVAIQFDGAANPVNPHFDWVPATGESDGIFTYQVAATETCNRCHDPLGIHGGNRIEVEYCVTCHNPGTTDANSGNTVDMKVMIHKIHYGENLPSVQAGTPYVIYGFRDSPHDYSEIVYPQDIRNCQNCHVGTGTTNDFYSEVQLTNQGDNWNEFPTQAACGSCHDDLDFSSHAGGQTDDSECASCHSLGERAGSVEESHALLIRDEGTNYLPEIISVSNTGPGEFPSIDFRITNPNTGVDWDILNDAPWTVGGGASRLAVDVAWNTDDYNNTGNDSDHASAVSIDALADATANGDGSFNVVSTIAIPDGSLAPNIPATGSGGVVVEGHPAVDVDESGSEDRIFMTNANDFYSIDEADGQADARRIIVDIDNCNSCHQNLVLHGNNRSDNIESCVTCHNARNTDRQVREIASSPPTDGKDEQSINFTTMVHGIHAAAILDNPLQIVGFRGFSTHVYDEEHVHYPGDLSNCKACHVPGGYELPLSSTVLGTTVDTGSDHESPTDDLVVTPETNACASCHDGTVAKAHMEDNGGSFATSQAAIDSGAVVEQCSVCHAPGRSADVNVVHDLD
ncbi:MAG: OmcA/MtrC family decaheme c-type cytochrome [Halieaceae bacterium]